MRMLLTVGLVSSALFVAACGGGGGEDTTSGSGAVRSGTVSVRSVDGVGDVLMTADGMALYASDQEMAGKIRCTGACTSFWTPLELGSGAPMAGGDAGKLSVIKRPDGTRQVTSNGMPLYTFSEDGRGEVSGNGFTDDFGGTHFVWHAVVAGGKPASSGDSGSGGSYSGGDSGGSYSNGGY
jgi:predicted lipoprotein with Yx(FWY)xxD motif